MATSMDGLPPDPLGLLRKAIAGKKLPIPTSDPDPSGQLQSNVTLAQASHMIFNSDTPEDGAQHIAIPLTQATRFISAAAGKKALDLRSVFFCWLRKDDSTNDYITACQDLTAQLQQTGKQEQVSNLIFAERVDLVNWLSADLGENESEFIQSLDNNRVTRLEATEAAKRAAGDNAGDDVEMRDADTFADEKKRREEEQQRLREIYAAERKMGDHNTVLRGVKVQDFSGVRKYSALFLGKGARPSAPAATQAPNANPAQAHRNPATATIATTTTATPTLSSNPALRPPIKPTAAGRRPEPIILLSPSASSLLRMPNIKSFLGEGVFEAITPGAESPSILHISRTLRSIAPTHATRFILVEDPSNFRPDYWNRVVAVFTTGQTWQFKNYKWPQPADLFSHALGIYVGWKGEVLPDTVKGWGRGVLSVGIDKGTQRWRDREVVEDIWGQIERRMRAMGWGRDGR